MPAENHVHLAGANYSSPAGSNKVSFSFSLFRLKSQVSETKTTNPPLKKQFQEERNTAIFNVGSSRHLTSDFMLVESPRGSPSTNFLFARLTRCCHLHFWAVVTTSKPQACLRHERFKGRNKIRLILITSLFKHHIMLLHIISR